MQPLLLTRQHMASSWLPMQLLTCNATQGFDVYVGRTLDALQAAKDERRPASCGLVHFFNPHEEDCKVPRHAENVLREASAEEHSKGGKREQAQIPPRADEFRGPGEVGGG